MYSEIKQFDLGGETIESLQRMLKNELYMNIDSPFAKEIIQEIQSRNQKVKK